MDFNHKDVNGEHPGMDKFPLLGSKWKHSGNSKIYTVTEYIWHGDTDEWHVEFRRANCPVPFTRTVNNFLGDRDNGVKRFTQVITNDKEIYIDETAEILKSYKAMTQEVASLIGDDFDNDNDLSEKIMVVLENHSNRMIDLNDKIMQTAIAGDKDAAALS